MRGGRLRYVVQDRSDSFTYVELDLKLEQSIQLASKSQGGIVGQTRMFAVVVEFELISHEVLFIQNNCRKLTNERMMEHHKTVMYQELRSIKAVIFDANVSRLRDCASCSKSLHTSIISSLIKCSVTMLCNLTPGAFSGIVLHNFTEHLINDEIMDAFENGETIQMRELILKTKKFAVTIHRCNLSVTDTKSNRASYTTISKLRSDLPSGTLRSPVYVE